MDEEKPISEDEGSTMIEKKAVDKDLNIEEVRKIRKNVVVISIAFMIHLTAITAAVNLQSSINAEAGLGTASLATMFVGVAISNILLTSVIIKWLGMKWTVCCSFLTYMPFIVCQAYPRFYTLIPASFLLGLGAGPLYCAKCTYLAMLAEIYSNLSKVSSGTMLLQFLGIFFMFAQMSQIWGNLISSLVLSMANNASLTSINESIIPQMCGVNFLPNSDAPEALPTQPPSKILMLAGIFFAFLFVSTMIVVVGLDSMKRYEARRKSSSTILSGFALISATIKQLGHTNQWLLVAINIFIGLHQAFFFADFTASFVSCAIGTGSVGYVMMVYGASDASGCYITGYLAKLFGRLPIISSALLIHGGVLLTLLLWHPRSEDYYIMLIIAALWGICDSVWTLQINAYYGVLFRGKEEPAFSNFRLWEAIGYIFAFAISSYVRTRYKVAILFGNLTVGVIGYYIVEYRQYRKNRKVLIKSIKL